MATYFPNIDISDVQTAICSVMSDNVDEEMAQSILDNFVDTTQITAVSGCTPAEEAAAIQAGLEKQIGYNTPEINDHIEEMYLEREESDEDY